MAKRDAIIQLHCAGVADPSIIKQLNVAKSTVYDAISRYKELGNSNDRPRTARPRTPSLEKMKKHFKDAGFTFQQDGAPSHTSNKTQQWCKTNFPNFWPKNIWPSSSPDRNPMDFSM